MTTDIEIDTNTETLEDLIKQLQEENREIRSILQKQTDASSAMSTTTTPEPKIALPQRFDGSRHLLRGFLSQTRLIFHLQPKRYPTDEARVGLIGTLLEGPALSWFASLIETSSTLLSTLKTFTEALETTFGDTDKSRTAATRIRRLRQGNRSAAVYASEFRQISCDVSWGETALIDQFRHGLQEAVKDLLLTIEDPQDPKDLHSREPVQPDTPTPRKPVPFVVDRANATRQYPTQNLNLSGKATSVERKPVPILWPTRTHREEMP